MSVVDAQQSLARFRAAISRRAGLHFADDKRPLLSSVLAARAHETGMSIEAYCARIEAGQDAEIEALAEVLTVAETYFFRNADHFRALREHVIPSLIETAPAGHRLRVLSAGCATGEEPYSIAMLLRQLGHADAEIVAFDLNPAVLAQAQRGRYSAWALRETDAITRARWFNTEGKTFVLSPEIRDAVRFVRGNLAEPAPTLLRQGYYDLVLCRNVLMYFTPDAMAQVIERLTQAIRDQGFLFLGHAETLRGRHARLQLRHTHATFYYQRARGAAVADALPDRVSRPHEPATASDKPLPWHEAIQAAADRVRHLTRTAESVPPSPAAEMTVTPRDSGDASSVITTRVAAPATDAATWIAKAAALLQAGDAISAEAIGIDLLQRDANAALAHHVLALCHEMRGDIAMATHHSEAATQLDAACALPRLHLGLLRRRSGSIEPAIDALREAQRLLPDEEARHIALFGGGFTREALLQLCAAELANLEQPR